MAMQVTDFFTQLSSLQVSFFTGVPDSLLKDFCGYLDDHVVANKHIIAANEGNAVAIAAGYHLATGQIPMVYLQNSGLGNTVNPLLSLADTEIYSIPLLLLIGWRGEPGKKDAIQHVKDGRIQESFLDSLEIPYSVLSPDDTQSFEKIRDAYQSAQEKSQPHVLLVKKGFFDAYTQNSSESNAYSLTRERALELVTRASQDAFFVSTTGKLSRELFEIRDRHSQIHDNDFLTVGSMGHASSIALGAALGQPEKQVVCLDGDGALLMHMGALGIIGQSNCKNLKHIVFNNGAHQSVGAQATVGFGIDIGSIARSCGYSWVKSVSDEKTLEEALPGFYQTDGPALLEIRINTLSRSDLGRPGVDLITMKKAFMRNMECN